MSPPSLRNDFQNRRTASTRLLVPLGLALIGFLSARCPCDGAQAVAAAGPQFRIEVVGSWGGASREDVQKTLNSAATQLLKFCPERRLGTIIVRHHDGTPITLYEKGPQGEYHVFLNAAGNYWAQYAYQFSHELTHILCNYDRRKEGRNLWFEEALCETASLFTMRKMAVAWKTDPPYKNWADFAPHLDEYVDAMLAKRQRRLPPDRTMSQWFREHEGTLSGQRHLTPESQLVAAYLVELFEDDSRGWETLAWINLDPKGTEGHFRDFLESWRQRTARQDQAFVQKIQRLFGLR